MFGVSHCVGEAVVLVSLAVLLLDPLLDLLSPLRTLLEIERKENPIANCGLSVLYGTWLTALVVGLVVV